MIIKRLKKYIELNGYKNKKIAEKLHVSNGHLSYILNGRREISEDIEKRIIDLID